jgi:hypothetical protein
MGCRRVRNRNVCSTPRTNWWKGQLGQDWFSGGSSAQAPTDDGLWHDNSYFSGDDGLWHDNSYFSGDDGLWHDNSYF